MHDIRLPSGFSLRGAALLEKAVKIARGLEPAFPQAKRSTGAGWAPIAPEVMGTFSQARNRFFSERPRKVLSPKSAIA